MRYGVCIVKQEIACPSRIIGPRLAFYSPKASPWINHPHLLNPFQHTTQVAHSGPAERILNNLKLESYLAWTRIRTSCQYCGSTMQRIKAAFLCYLAGEYSHKGLQTRAAAQFIDSYLMDLGPPSHRQFEGGNTHKAVNGWIFIVLGLALSWDNGVTVGCTSIADLNLLLYSHYSLKDNRKYVLKLALTTVVFHHLSGAQL